MSPAPRQVNGTSRATLRARPAPMLWTFRILAALNLLMLAAAFLYRSPGEDPAGAGLRLGFAVVYAIALAAVLLAYRFAATLWIRVPMLVLLALPALSVLYGIWLSL